MFLRLIRLITIEIEKLIHQRMLWVALVLITLTIVLSVWTVPDGNPNPKEKSHVKGLRSDGGFAPFTRGCLAGFQLATIFLLTLASLSISQETSSGTLRMILTRAFRRGELILAKILILLVLVVVVTFLVGLLTMALVDSIYGFGPVVDSYEPSYQHVTKEVMFRYCLYSSILVLLPLGTVVCFGLFISSLIENMGVAIALTILVYLTLDYFVVPLFEQIAPYLFSYYTTIYFKTLYNLAGGILSEIWRFRVIDGWLGYETAGFIPKPSEQWAVIKSIIIPLGYTIIFVSSSLVIFKKKDVLV